MRVIEAGYTAEAVMKETEHVSGQAQWGWYMCLEAGLWVSRLGGEDAQEQLVIQGSHMVSGTRCPAWSD